MVNIGYVNIVDVVELRQNNGTENSNKIMDRFVKYTIKKGKNGK